MVDEVLLARHPLFHNAPLDELRGLIDRSRVRVFRPEEVIFHQDDFGDGLYIVKSGAVKISVAIEGGQESTIALMFPGDCFGELAVLDDDTRSASAVALERTETLFIKRVDFRAFLERCPSVAMRVIELLCERVRRTDAAVADLIFSDVYGRVAKKLLELAETRGTTLPDGAITIDLQLTQQDLADMVGASRESVNKVLKYYRDKQFISVTNQKTTITNPEGLRRRFE